MQIDGVTDFKFEDTGGVWQGRFLPYKNIIAVSWLATITQNSINGIPTGKSYQASLYVYLNTGEGVAITGDGGLLGGLGKKGFEGLASVAEVLSELTFAYRVERYEKAVREKKFFQYGDYQFHSSGELFYKGIEKLSLISRQTKFLLENVFDLKIVPERKNKSVLGWFEDTSVKLVLQTNRDCILYMLRKMYGISFPDVQLREKRYPPRETFYEAVVRFGALLAAADGKADAVELSRLKQYFSISSDSFPEAAKYYNEQLQNRESAEIILDVFSKCFYEADELKETFLFGMAEVAVSDGVAHPKEIELLWEAVKILSIPHEVAVRILESVGIGVSANSDRNFHAESGIMTRYRCFAVLGLKDGASSDEIKSAYRDLVRRYHPDVLRSQNLPDEEIQRLGILMRRINEAYSLLKEDG